MSPAFRKNLIHTLIVIAGFILVSVVFNHPAITGKVLAPSDYLNWKNVAEESRAWQQRTGEDVLWSNSMFGGMPSNTFFGPNTNNYVGTIGQFFLDILPRPANFMFMAMLCFFILMSTMRINKWLGAVGAVAYAFATYNCVISATGHETKMIDIAYMPAVLAGLLLLMRGRYLLGAIVFGVFMSLSVRAGHYQIVYYLLLVLLVAGIGMLVNQVKNGTAKTAIIGAVLAVVMGGLAIGTNMNNLLPTMEYSRQTQRGGASELHTHDKGKKSGGLDKDYAFGWSNGVGETFCILVPYLYGGSSNETAAHLPQTNEATGGQYPGLPAYWGPQSILMGPVYFGAIVCFLFVLGMMLIRNPLKWWLFGIAAVAVLMSVGDHFKAFNYFLFDHLPGLNKFRAPSTALVIPQFLFPLIGVWGINEALKGKVDKATFWKKAKIAAIITGGLALLVGVLSSMFFDFTNPARDAQLPAEILKVLKEDRIAMARKSGLFSAVFIAAGAALIWLFSRERIKGQWLIAGLGLIVAFDLLPVGYNYLSDKPEDPNGPYKAREEYDAYFQPRPADQQILADKDPYYRVLDVTGGVFSDSKPSFFHKSIGGYSAAKLENYQDLIDVHMSKGFNGEVLNMLNTKYIVVPGGGPGREGVIPNPKACGNAWFVPEIKWTKTAEEEIAALNAPVLGDTVQVPNAFDPKKTAVLRETQQQALQGFTPAADSSASIRLTKYGLKDLSYESVNSKEGLAIFSDIYYNNGWKAFVDGKETPIIRADYALRALRVPAGNHKIEFRYSPKSYETGKTISLISSLLFLALIACWLWFDVFRKKTEAPAATA